MSPTHVPRKAGQAHRPCPCLDSSAGLPKQANDVQANRRALEGIVAPLRSSTGPSAPACPAPQQHGAIRPCMPHTSAPSAPNPPVPPTRKGEKAARLGSHTWTPSKCPTCFPPPARAEKQAGR
eukprot:257138-Chlamydomonas_euryale.AAC.1